MASTLFTITKGPSLLKMLFSLADELDKWEGQRTVDFTIEGVVDPVAVCITWLGGRSSDGATWKIIAWVPNRPREIFMPPSPFVDHRLAVTFNCVTRTGTMRIVPRPKKDTTQKS